MILEQTYNIKKDVVECFQRVVSDTNNIAYGDVNWDAVESQMYTELNNTYARSHISNCVDMLADEYNSNVAVERLNILKKHYLGYED